MDSISLPKLQVNQITSQLKARSDSLHNIWVATQADDKLAILKYIIQQDGQKQLRKFQSRYRNTGPSMKNS